MTGPLKQAVLIIVAVIGVTSTAIAQHLSTQQRTTILTHAQQSYDQGVASLRNDPTLARRKFQQAVDRFQQLVDDGVVNGYLHYNLGNALLQVDELGPAILHYRAAQTLIPGDAALQHNLEYARTLRQSKIEENSEQALVDALLKWHSTTRTGTRMVLFLTFYSMFWGLLIFSILRSTTIWKWAVSILAVLWIILGLSIMWDLVVSEPGSIGVVLTDEVIVRKGNGIGFEPQFLEALSEGVEFKLLEQRAEWLRIELPNGKSGWIEAADAKLVRDALAGSTPMSHSNG